MLSRNDVIFPIDQRTSLLSMLIPTIRKTAVPSVKRIPFLDSLVPTVPRGACFYKNRAKTNSNVHPLRYESKRIKLLKGGKTVQLNFFSFSLTSSWRSFTYLCLGLLILIIQIISFILNRVLRLTLWRLILIFRLSRT